MKIGVCGLGPLGADFAELFAFHPDVEELWVADAIEEVRDRVGSATGAARILSSLDQVLDGDLDAVAVFTPPWLHAEQAVLAMEAGKNVLSACPIGLSLDEIGRVVAAVERTGRLYMQAETSYYYPGAVFSRDAWRQGRFGEFVYAEGEYYYRPHAYPFWMRDHYANMPPMLYPTHSTTMTVSVLGRPFARVTCVGTPGLHVDAATRARRPAWADNETSNMTMLGQMAGGGVCRINEFRNVGCEGELGSFFGTLGSIRQHSGGAVWSNGLRWEALGGEHIDLSELWRDDAHHPHADLVRRLPEPLRGRGLGHEGSHRFLADEFVRSVVQDRRPHNNVWMAARCGVPGVIAWDSYRQDGQWLDVPDFGEPTDGREPLPH